MRGSRAAYYSWLVQSCFRLWPSVNLAPVEFGRVVGLYIAMLFIVWQIVNWIVFRSLPDAPVFFSGVLIIIGGAVVTFWK